MRNESPSSHVSRRAALTGLAATAAVGVSATQANAATRSTTPVTTVTSRTNSARTMDSMIDEAASKFGVPGELIAAVGWENSRLEGRSGEPSIDHGFGVMNLVDNPSNRTLATAARLTGLSAQELKMADAANILGGAALLRQTADAQLLSGADREALDLWVPTLAVYSGARDQAIADEYANSVATTLTEGLAGKGVRVMPTNIPNAARKGVVAVSEVKATARAATRPVANPQPIGTQMPATVSYPAYGGNYTSADRPRDYPIDYVIIHITQGSWASALNWFQNPAARVSAHYTVRSRDGRIGQSVDRDDYAWHAGNRSYNQKSIGIEHEGFISNPSYFTDAMYRASAAITRAVCDQYNIPKTRTYIRGHIEVPGATHTDPGRYWDWNKYMSYVRASAPRPTWQIILDNSAPEFRSSANWKVASAGTQLGKTIRVTTPKATSDAAWYSATLPSDGVYVIETRYPAHYSYNNLVPYVINAAGGRETVYVNQRHLGGQWRSLGTYRFRKGRQDIVAISRWAKGTGKIIADGIRISKIG